MSILASRRLCFVIGAAAVCILPVAADAATFGYDDTFWGNSVGSANGRAEGATGDGISGSIDPVVATSWLASPGDFHGIAIAPANRPGYFGNYMMPGSDQGWMHQRLDLTFSDSTTAQLDQTGQRAAMIQQDLPTTHNHTGPLGQRNGPYLVMYEWDIPAEHEGKTVTAATLTVDSWFGEKWASPGMPFDIFEAPTAWDRDTITYANYVVAVPEPSTAISLLAAAVVPLARRHRRAS